MRILDINILYCKRYAKSKKYSNLLLSPKPPLLNQRRASPPATRRLDVPPLLNSSVDNMIICPLLRIIRATHRVGKHFSREKDPRFTKHVT